MRRIFGLLLATSILAACVQNAASPTGSSLAALPQGRAAAQTTAPPPVLNGCQMFPAPNPTPTGQSWWNQDISTYPVDPNSATYIANLPGNLHPDFGHEAYYGIPYNVVPANQPLVPVKFVNYPSQSDPGPYPIPNNAQIEGQPLYHTGDRHLLILQEGTCTLYEMWEAVKLGTNKWQAANGAVFHLNSTKLRPNGWTSADAAGLPITPALIKCSEVAAGAIDHAMRVTFNNTQGGFIHPATHEAGSASDTNLPPMGERLRLKASFDISHFNRVSKIILTAMQHYGLFVADNGSNWYFQGQGGKQASCWNDNQLDELKNVPGSAFEAVETGPIMH